MIRNLTLCVLALLVASPAFGGADPQTLEWIFVPQGNTDHPDLGCGAVNYDYYIAKTEVTVAQYRSQILDMEHPTGGGVGGEAMWNGCMNRTAPFNTGSCGGYVAALNQIATCNEGDNDCDEEWSWPMLANYQHALAFVDYMNGRQLDDVDHDYTDGLPAYDTDLNTSSLPTLVEREASGWEYALPTLDEWCRAAFWDPVEEDWQDPPAPTFDDEPDATATNKVNGAQYDSESVGDWNLLPVGSFPDTQYGVGALDILGNAAEFLVDGATPTLILAGGDFQSSASECWDDSTPADYWDCPVINGSPTTSLLPGGSGADLGGIRLVAVAHDYAEPDADDDGIPNPIDNCVNDAQDPDPSDASNCDTDQDGYGNWCDGDYNQDGAQTEVCGGPYCYGDYSSYWVPAYYTQVNDQGEDMDCSGSITTSDGTRWNTLFALPSGERIGPSGVSCADPTNTSADCDTPDEL